MSKLSGYRHERIARCLTNKLYINFRGSKELVGWYEIDNKKILRIILPKGHSHDVSLRVIRKLIGQLRLNAVEFDQLYECPMTGSVYEAKIRDIFNIKQISNKNSATN